MKKGRIKEFFSDIWDGIKELFTRIVSERGLILIIVFALLFCIIAARVFYLQIVKSDYYTENFTQKSTKVITTEAARGNIYDCNGVLLAYNTISYSVTMTDEIPSSDKRGAILNGISYRTYKIIEDHGDQIVDGFNIEYYNGIYRFKADPPVRMITFLINVYGEKSSVIYEKGYDKKTAEEVMEFIIDKYKISDEYTKEEKLKIATLRYMLSLTAYQKYMSTVIATDISEATKAAILESTDDLRGVAITESYKRVYNYPELYSHIIGYTGLISADLLEEYNLENPENEYTASDIVGKSGIEMTMDSVLQGKKGERTVVVDSTGNILETVSETRSSSGADIYLSIDTDLQEVAYDVLEKHLASCLINKIVNYDYKQLEPKQTYVYIGIKDVYHSILTNIIDYNAFSRDDASSREKAVLKAYGDYLKKALEKIGTELKKANPAPVGELEEDLNDYMFQAYYMLGAIGILDTSLVDRSTELYTSWMAEEISFREFLQGAIAENWVDISVIDASRKYSDSNELYNDIVEVILNTIPENKDYIDRIYYNMIYDGTIDPYDICLMLYDQNILEKDDNYTELAGRAIDTYHYVIRQITGLKLTPAMLALDPCSGSMCLTDTEGHVKALVSYPNYDNNKLSGHVDPDYWAELISDPTQPLFNYATQALTAPGSTFKLCTSVAGLAEGYVTPETTVYDDGYFTLVSPSPKCYIYPYSHGSENVSTALRDSCNYYFFQVGYDMGLDELGNYSSSKALDIITDYAEQLGLGIDSGVELTERSPFVSDTDSVRTAIGQGTSGFAAVHMARYVNTVANSGTNYQLSIISKIVEKNGNTLSDGSPVVTNRIEMAQENWDAIHYGMRLVCTSGTASKFFLNLRTTVAGKTGTAEEDPYRSNHTAFVGYAPYETPQVSFSCMIRNSDSTSYPGGVMEDILMYYFGQLTKEEALELPVESDNAGFYSE